MLNRIQFEKDQKKAREEQIDQLSAYLADYIKVNNKMREQPPRWEADPALLKEVAAIPIPRQGRDPKEVAEELVKKGFEPSLLLQHPRFFSFVTSGVSPYALAGAVLADIYNVNVAGFSLAPTLGVIEEKLIKWMGSLAGFGDKCGGVFTSGGSLSNLTGCIAARHKYLPEKDYPIGQAYVSDQTHSSVKKGLKLMGLRLDQITIIPTDDDYRMRVDLLEEEIRKDIAAGKKPFLVVPTVGTTNTGSIDPLPLIADIKEKYGMWMHVDGAYGGSILFSDIYRNLASGIERADSLSWDTHKWAMQGYSSSCLIAKDKNDLVTTYAEHPEYLADIIDAEHTDGWDLGIEMSRPARAVKLWFTVQAMGTDLLSDVIDYSFFNAKLAYKELTSRPDWEITSKPMCGTITFRYAPKDVDESRYDALNAAISEQIIKERFAYIVTTVIKNKRVLRLNIINGNTVDTDVIETVAKLDEIAVKLHPLYRT